MRFYVRHTKPLAFSQKVQLALKTTVDKMVRPCYVIKIGLTKFGDQMLYVFLHLKVNK